MRVFSACVMAVCGLACSAAMGQTITDGAATFQMLTPAFSTTLGDSTLKNDGAGSPDIQYKYCWYYRTELNSVNSVFSKWDTPVAFTQGNQTRITWTNAGPGVAGQERFNAELLLRLRHGPGTNQTRLFSRMKIESAAFGSRMYNFFHLCDLDMPGGNPNPAPDDKQTFDPNTGIGLFSELSSTNKGRVAATEYQAYDVSSGTDLRARLGSGAGSLFGDTSFNGDGAIAFQWIWNLDPGQVKIVRVGQSYNTAVYTSDPCGADFNRDNMVDDSDFSGFVVAYEALMCPDLPAFCDADLNEDGVVDDGDFEVFVGQYEALVCPW